MKIFLKHFTIVIFLLLFPSILLAEITPEKIKEEIQRLQLLDESLSDGGIEGLLKTALDKSYNAPKINSKYFAERIAKQEPSLASLEQAKRAFGLKVARTLDEIAADSRQEKTSDRQIKQATLLLDLADWLKVQRGYGNYLLVIRCENLAAVPLGYLTGDLAFPMEKISTQMKRIMSEQKQREFRRDILNSEAPKPFIGVLTGSQSQQDEQMQIAWGTQWNEMSKWFKARGVGISKRKRSDAPDSLAFFLVESPNGPKTTSGSWDMDVHYGIAINGMRDVNIRNIDSFAKYRELVGTFPTEPPKWWKPGDPLYSKNRAAFEHAWRPYEEKYGPLFDIASMVYEQVTSNTLKDWETQNQIHEAKLKP
jgi:hypothetical protein